MNFAKWSLLLFAFLPLAHAIPDPTRPGRVFSCEDFASGGTIEFLRGMKGGILVRPPGAQKDISTVTYSLDFTLTSFGLKPEHLRFFKNKKVILVGEGFGVLLPAMIDAEADVIAADPLYAIHVAEALNVPQLQDSQRKALSNIAAFLNQYRERLRVGTAQNLPLETASQDYYLSHFVYQNFRFDDREIDWAYLRAAFAESLRVVKPGGKIYDVMLIRDSMVQFKIESMLKEFKKEGQLATYSIDKLPVRPAQIREENGFNTDDRFISSRISITR